jgi:aminoglycoside phosphotransferase (APT) family kinase protein
MIGLAPDPRLPQRDELLDPASVAALLGRTGGARTYAKYRLGESLRVVHRIDGCHVAARTFPDGESETAYARALESAVPANGLPPVIHARPLGAVLWTFPNDRRLTSLPLLADGSPELAELVGRRCRTEIVAYAAERSASARCLDEAGRLIAYAKVHAHEAQEPARLEAAARAGVRVPRVLAASDGAMVLEPIAGRRLDTLMAGELPAALRGLGAALAALHTRVPAPPRPFTRLGPERLARSVAVIARGRPDAGGPAARVLAALLERPDHARGPAVCLHGDANLRNAILSGDQVALVDLEDAAAGPAAADLGQVLAGLLTARIRGAIDEKTERALGDALLAGYAHPPGWDALRWQTAAAVLARVALPAVNRVRPELLPRLRELLTAAEALPV